MKISYTDKETLLQRIAKIRSLGSRRVLVGLPEKASPRLRRILAIQAHGSPVNHIPPRPVVRPALADPDTRAAMAAAMKDALRSAWQGNDPQPNLEAAGRIGADAIRAKIDAGVPPPNSPATVARKGFDKPLYDTGALYRAFDYEIR